jgi:hypothetical protein
VVFQEFAQHVFVIAAHAVDVPVGEQIETATRLIVIADEIAAAQQPIDATRARRRKDRFEGAGVAMNVGEQAQPH